MNVDVAIATPRKLAAVRRTVAPGGVGAVWKPALDQVWAFLRAHPGLRTDGHNIFVYRHPEHAGASMEVELGVEVTRSFDADGEVVPSETPAGEIAVAVHVGGYDRLHVAHDAIQQFCAREGRALAGVSWEIYGDWSDDETKLETTVCYLLTPLR